MFRVAFTSRIYLMAYFVTWQVSLMLKLLFFLSKLSCGDRTRKNILSSKLNAYSWKSITYDVFSHSINHNKIIFIDRWMFFTSYVLCIVFTWRWMKMYATDIKIVFTDRKSLPTKQYIFSKSKFCQNQQHMISLSSL